MADRLMHNAEAPMGLADHHGDESEYSHMVWLTGGTITIWAPSLQSNETADDSDKEFTVTAGKEWHVMWVWVEFTSGSVAGTRQLELQLKDGSDDVIMQLQPGATQAASLTRNYLFAPGMADLVSFRDTSYLMTPIPPTLILPASYDIRVWDNNAIAAAEDDMILQMMVLERTA